MSVVDTEYNWVNHTPPALQPFLKLARLDRPIGTWLLLWPCLWAIFLASKIHTGQWLNETTLVLVTAGAILMRGAGCTLNDIFDRRYDRAVARTAHRPLAMGEVSLAAAIGFLIFQLLFAAKILFFFNATAVVLGLSILPLIVIYPLMKRITFWPQLWLGLAFNWGAILGWAIISPTFDGRSLLLYIGGICWTLGYDTIYAHQDKEDDALLGLKSTALLFGKETKWWLSLFYTIAWLCFTLTDIHISVLHIGACMLMLGHLGWQIRQLDTAQPSVCLHIFRSNRLFGFIVLLYFIT